MALSRVARPTATVYSLTDCETYTRWTVAIIAATSADVTTEDTRASGDVAWCVSSISISESLSG